MIRIQVMTAADWTDVEQIYAAGIASGEATFETDTRRGLIRPTRCA